MDMREYLGSTFLKPADVRNGPIEATILDRKPWRTAIPRSSGRYHHEAVLPADKWPNAVLVRDFGPRMVCTVCGIIGADARPNSREMPTRGNWRTHQARMIAMTKSAI